MSLEIRRAEEHTSVSNTQSSGAPLVPDDVEVFLIGRRLKVRSDSVELRVRRPSSIDRCQAVNRERSFSENGVPALAPVAVRSPEGED